MKWGTTTTKLRTFFLDNPEYDPEALLEEKYMEFAEYLGRPYPQ